MIVVPFDERIAYDFSSKVAIENGRNEINTFLAQTYKQQLPGEFWDTPSKKRLSKKISEFFHKEYNIGISDWYLSVIGNLIERSGVETKPLIFDFSRNLNWKAGEYGDGSSCFFTYNSRHRYALELAGAFALRFYTQEQKGYARAWIMQISPDALVIFNGYGEKTAKMSQIIAAYFGTSNAPVKAKVFDINGKTNSLFYHNNDVFRIGEAADTIHLQIPKVETIFRCAKCNTLSLDRNDLCPNCNQPMVAV